MVADIFRRFASRPDPNINCYNLLDFFHGRTSILSTAPYQDLPPAQAMTRIGLTQQMQAAILDPRFSKIFGTETLRYWIDDTLRINYLTLMQLVRRLKNHATGIIAKKKEAKRAKLEDAFPTLPHPQQAATNARLNVIPEDHYLPKSFDTADELGEVLEGHYVQQKAKAASEMGDSQWPQDDGSLEMSVTASHAGGDFNHENVVWYWNPETERAAAHRA